ncbi:MAG: flippase-like domain-containing protein [Chloroflexi bacterium]|nr:flippase-like domain-containing protein [Chloroflexota bacterium]
MPTHSATASQSVISQRVWSFAKIAVSLGVLIFLLTRLNRADLIERLASAQLLWLGLALALYFCAILLGVLKWHLLVRAQHLAISFRNLATFTFTGLFLGNVLPSNIGGDVVRAAMLAQAGRGTTEAAAISVVVDRLLGLAAFFGVTLISAGLAVGLLTRSTELEAIQTATTIIATAFAIGGAFFFSRRAARQLARIFAIGWFARFKPMALRFYHAIQMYRFNYAALAANIALSTGILVVATLVWYSVARALDLHISLIYFFLFNPLIAFVLLLPISFNGLGPKEATAVFFFGLIGVPSEAAFALSLLFHAIVVLTSLPGGVFVVRSRTDQPGHPDE